MRKSDFKLVRMSLVLAVPAFLICSLLTPATSDSSARLNSQQAAQMASLDRRYAELEQLLDSGSARSFEPVSALLLKPEWEERNEFWRQTAKTINRREIKIT